MRGGSGVPKPEYEFHEPAEQPWEPAGAPGFFQKILSEDSETGDYTRLARMEPGTDTSELGTFTHDFWEEVFIIRGSLTDLRLGGRFEAGFYACRPPGMPHGPYRSDEGILMFEVRYGFPR